MREILFRGKRIDNGEWVWGGALYTIGGKETLIAPLGSMMVEVLAETVGQFTGLTDKNGRYIFEGDIVKTEYENSLIGGTMTNLFTVFYKSNSLAFAIKKINSIDDMPLMFVRKDRLEIIGNIFDNPELMKE